MRSALGKSRGGSGFRGDRRKEHRLLSGCANGAVSGNTAQRTGTAPPIADHNSKYLITLDDDPKTSHDGIRQVNAVDWLLDA
jgi:hypothetical protein